MRLFRRLLPYVLLAFCTLALFLVTRPDIYHFDGLVGPDRESRVEPSAPADMAAYGASTEGSASRLALLVTDPDSDWLGLAHGLKTIGVPFVATRSWQEALTHKVVLAYPAISGRLLDKAALQALAAHPRNGGTLVAFEVLGGGLQEVFGFRDVAAARTHKSLGFEPQAVRLLGFAADESKIPLAGSEGGTGSYAFDPTTAEVWARYDDGAPAVIRRASDPGQAIAIGIDIGSYIAKSYNGRQNLGHSYINAYEPAVDVLLRFIRRIYRAAEPLAVTLDTVPDGRNASLIVTHDIDYSRSIENAVRYAEVERAQGVAATYFIQTKYVRDWNDDVFFNARGAELTRRVAALGMEIGSHSVSHSRMFSKFPLGDGRERYPSYVPFVRSRLETKDGTVLGELRVSRFLLESAVPGLRVESFRPGHLQYPFSLPQALQASGYRYSSSLSSGTALTHLPFQLSYNRENRAETPVFEFPLTIEDELDRPMTARQDKTNDILDRLQRYGGMCIVLIHTDVFADKLPFLEALLAEAKRRELWIGPLRAFGGWWAARNGATVDVVRQADGALAVMLDLPPGVDGLTLQVPEGWRLLPGAGSVAATQNGVSVVLRNAVGKVQLSFGKG